MEHIIKNCAKWDHIRNDYFRDGWRNMKIKDLLLDYRSTLGCKRIIYEVFNIVIRSLS